MLHVGHVGHASHASFMGSSVITDHHRLSSPAHAGLHHAGGSEALPTLAQVDLLAQLNQSSNHHALQAHNRTYCYYALFRHVTTILLTPV